MRKFYILFAFVASTIGFAQQYELVTNQTNIQTGAKYLIVGQNTASSGANVNKVYVLSSTQNTNNRAAIELTGTTSLPSVINFESSYASFLLASGTVSTSNFSFFEEIFNNNEGGYLYAASSTSNHLKTQTINNENGEFEITIQSNNVADIVAQGTSTRNIIRFNGSNNPPIFSCYGSGQMNVYLYKLIESASPILSTSVTAINNFEYIENEGPSESQQFTIYGSNLDGTAVIATAPTNFEVSIDNVTFEPTVTLPTFNGTETPIHARLISGLAPAEYSGNITISGGGINSTLSVALTGEVFEAQSIPALSVNTTNITGLTYVEQNGPSLPQSFQITGINTNGIDVTVTAPTAFLVSLNAVTYSQYVTLENFNGAEQIVYVYLASELQEGNYNGEITISAGSIPTPLTISVSGTVTALVLNPELTIDTTEIAELIYNEGEGPSESESFNLSGSELDGTNVVIVASENFEVSVDNTNFLSQVTLPAFDGLEKLIYVRLASDLTANTYTGNLTINGGGITNALTISLAGEVIPTASIKENNIEGLKVYPNPASDLINISSNELGSKEVIIFNVLGKKVLETSTEETVNVSNLTSGVYIINITQDGKKASRKLIIK